MPAGSRANFAASAVCSRAKASAPPSGERASKVAMMWLDWPVGQSSGMAVSQTTTGAEAVCVGVGSVWARAMPPPVAVSAMKSAMEAASARHAAKIGLEAVVLSGSLTCSPPALLRASQVLPRCAARGMCIH